MQDWDIESVCVCVCGVSACVTKYAGLESGRSYYSGHRSSSVYY